MCEFSHPLGFQKQSFDHGRDVFCRLCKDDHTLCKKEIMESNASGDHYSSCCCWPLMFLYLLRALLDKRELCQLCVCEWVRVLSVQRSFAPT